MISTDNIRLGFLSEYPIFSGIHDFKISNPGSRDFRIRETFKYRSLSRDIPKFGIFDLFNNKKPSFQTNWFIGYQKWYNLVIILKFSNLDPRIDPFFGESFESVETLRRCSRRNFSLISRNEGESGNNRCAKIILVKFH